MSSKCQIAVGVIGQGVSGRLHAGILQEIGIDVTAIDPRESDLSRVRRHLRCLFDEVPVHEVSAIDTWWICTPTSTHLSVLTRLLDLNPTAHVVVEKPLCDGSQLAALRELLQRRCLAKVLVNEQYRHSQSLSVLLDLVADLEPERSVRKIEIVFEKDRRPDVAKGRYVDSAFGVLGYEWPHMLTILARLLPKEMLELYLHRANSWLWPEYAHDRSIEALRERTLLTTPRRRILVDLFSSVVGVETLTAIPLRPQLRTAIASAGRSTSYRRVSIACGNTAAVLHLDPATTSQGVRLPRNWHRLTAVRNGRTIHDEVIHDSPLHAAVIAALATVMKVEILPPSDLAQLERLILLSELLRRHSPAVESGEAVRDMLSAQTVNKTYAPKLVAAQGSHVVDA